MEKITLNNCIQWGMKHPSLEAIQKWEEEQLASFKQRIERKKSHVAELEKEKEDLKNNQAAKKADQELQTLRNEKVAALKEIENNAMRKVFWKKKMDELQNEIDMLDSKRNLSNHRAEEKKALILEIEGNILTEQKSIENYEKLYEESLKILEDLKKETRMRTGVPFGSLDFTKIIMLMRQCISEGKTMFSIEVQAGNSNVSFLVGTDEDGNSLFGACLNNDPIFDESFDNKEIETKIQSLYDLFGDTLCKVFDDNERPEQAMNGQFIDKEKMETIYEIAGHINQCMENLNAEMSRYYRSMNLPEDIDPNGKYNADETLEKLETRVTSVLEQEAIMSKEPLPQIKVKKVNKPVSSPVNKPEKVVTPQPQMAPKVPTKPKMEKKEEKIEEISIPSFADSTPKKEPVAPTPVKPVKPKTKKNTGGVLYDSGDIKPMPKVLTKVEDSDMNFEEFQETYQADKLANIEKSKRTVRESIIEQNKEPNKKERK